MVTLIELLRIARALSDERRRRSAELLVTELITAEGTAAERVERGRSVPWSDVFVAQHPAAPDQGAVR